MSFISDVTTALSNMVSKTIRAVSARALISQKVPPMLVDSILPSNSLAVAYGPPAGGKTFMIVDLAMSIATGRRFLGHATKQGPVVYIAAERSATLGKRAAAWLHAHGIVDCTEIAFVQAPVQLLNANEVGELRALLASLPQKPVLIVIDTLSRCMAGGDENGTRDMGAVVQALDHLRAEAGGATVLVVHHTRKSDETERGSSLLRGAADTMVAIKKNEDVVVMESRKSSDGAEFPALHARLVPQPTGSCVLVRLDDTTPSTPVPFVPSKRDILFLETLASAPKPLSGRECSKLAGISKTSGSSIKAVLLEQGLIEEPTRGQLTVTAAGHALLPRAA